MKKLITIVAAVFAVSAFAQTAPVAPVAKPAVVKKGDKPAKSTAPVATPSTKTPTAK